jgi:hypothetical protein
MKQQEQLVQILTELVQTNGTANCYDRYCNDDEWTYCIFCMEGDFDPDRKPGWKHDPGCLMVRARALLDILIEDNEARAADTASRRRQGALDGWELRRRKEQP